MARKNSKSVYSVHPGVAMVQEWIVGLPQKTGKSLEQWIALVKREGPSTTKERRDWLKKQFKLGTNSACWIVDRAEGRGTEDGDPELYLKAAEGYVEEMFAGAKAGLRPLYDALLDLGLSLGKDVRACPCQTIVPLYRKHVFAQIKPRTQTRIDFGLALGDSKATGKLIDTGGYAKKDRITHRFVVTTMSDINADVRRWSRIAYDRDT